MKIKSAIVLMLLSVCAYSQTADEIIRRLENSRSPATAWVKGNIVITDRFGEKRTDYLAWMEGDDRALIEFTSIEERGQKILRNKDQISLYYPDSEEIIVLKGASLKDSVLGSDMSYEDMTGGKSLLENYKAELLGTEEVNGRSCFKLKLKAVKKNVPYPEQTLWIDRQFYTALKAEYFSLSGKLIKDIVFSDIRLVKNHYVPFRIEIRDALKSNSGTLMIMQEYKTDVKLPAGIFSLSGLSW